MTASRYRIYDSSVPHFVTCTVVNWLPLFANPAVVDIVLNSIRHLQSSVDLRVHGYVIMENHLHLIASCPDLGGALASFKSFTARRIAERLLEDGKGGALREMIFAARDRSGPRRHQVWEEGVHPQQIAGEAMLRQKLDYMHSNPVRRGYVDDPTAWVNSSARNYAGLPGVLEVEMLT